MKLNKLFSLAVLSIIFALAGCASDSGVKKVDIVQVASVVCTQSKIFIPVAESFATASPKVEEALAIIKPLAALTCAGQEIDYKSISDIATKGIPALVDAVQAIDMGDKDRERILLALSVTQAIITAYVASQQTS